MNRSRTRIAASWKIIGEHALELFLIGSLSARDDGVSIIGDDPFGPTARSSTMIYRLTARQILAMFSIRLILNDFLNRSQ